jgi:hypothetical protein
MLRRFIQKVVDEIDLATDCNGRGCGLMQCIIELALCANSGRSH